jgi:hypothetical protein
MKRRELIVDQRESGDLTVLICTRQETDERTTSLNGRRTNDMTKAEGFLTNPKKHLELPEISRTPTIVLSCLRVYLDAHRTFSNARSCSITRRACARKKQKEESFPNRNRNKDHAIIHSTGPRNPSFLRLHFSSEWMNFGKNNIHTPLADNMAEKLKTSHLVGGPCKNGRSEL